MNIRKQLLAFSAWILLATASVFAESGYAVVHRVSGDVSFQRPADEKVYVLERGFELPVGTRIMSGEDGTAVLKITSGTAVRVSQNTELVLNNMQEKSGKQKIRLTLDKGTLGSLIDKSQRENTDFRIETPQGSAAARGTFYAVSVVNGNTYVKVDEGVVELFKPVE